MSQTPNPAEGTKIFSPYNSLLAVTENIDSQGADAIDGFAFTTGQKVNLKGEDISYNECAKLLIDESLEISLEYPIEPNERQTLDNNFAVLLALRTGTIRQLAKEYSDDPAQILERVQQLFAIDNELLQNAVSVGNLKAFARFLAAQTYADLLAAGISYSTIIEIEFKRDLLTFESATGPGKENLFDFRNDSSAFDKRLTSLIEVLQAHILQPEDFDTRLNLSGILGKDEIKSNPKLYFELLTSIANRRGPVNKTEKAFLAKLDLQTLQPYLVDDDPAIRKRAVLWLYKVINYLDDQRVYQLFSQNITAASETDDMQEIEPYAMLISCFGKVCRNSGLELEQSQVAGIKRILRSLVYNHCAALLVKEDVVKQLIIIETILSSFSINEMRRLTDYKPELGNMEQLAEIPTLGEIMISLQQRNTLLFRRNISKFIQIGLLTTPFHSEQN